MTTGKAHWVRPQPVRLHSCSVNKWTGTRRCFLLFFDAFQRPNRRKCLVMRHRRNHAHSHRPGSPPHLWKELKWVHLVAFQGLEATDAIRFSAFASAEPACLCICGKERKLSSTFQEHTCTCDPWGNTASARTFLRLLQQDKTVRFFFLLLLFF